MVPYGQMLKKLPKLEYNKFLSVDELRSILNDKLSRSV